MSGNFFLRLLFVFTLLSCVGACQKEKETQQCLPIDSPACLLEGTYTVIASHYEATPGINFDTVYGPTTITIKRIEDSVILFNDDRLLKRQFNVVGNSPNGYVFNSANELFLGDRHSEYITYKYSTQEILVSTGVLTLGGSTATEWKGTKN